MALRGVEAREAGEAAELALAWIEHDLLPRVIVADDLAILWSNVAARSLLAARRDVEERGGMFATVDRSKQAALIRFVTTSEVAISSWAFPRADGDGHLLFRAQRIDWRGGGMFGVGFYGSGSEFQARYADLDTIFGLTAAEHRVLLDMLEGLEADRLSESTRSRSRRPAPTFATSMPSFRCVRARDCSTGCGPTGYERVEPYRL